MRKAPKYCVMHFRITNEDLHTMHEILQQTEFADGELGTWVKKLKFAFFVSIFVMLHVIN